MQKRQVDYLVHLLFRRLRIQFKKIEKDPGAETIKPFRIGIKKLRALLRLVSLETPDSPPIKLPGSLKTMHRSGGKIRDLELLEEKILQATRVKRGINLNKSALIRPQKKYSRAKETEFLSLDEFYK